jgi:hypothetical protein
MQPSIASVQRHRFQCGVGVSREQRRSEAHHSLEWRTERSSMAFIQQGKSFRDLDQECLVCLFLIVLSNLCACESGEQSSILPGWRGEMPPRWNSAGLPAALGWMARSDPAPCAALAMPPIASKHCPTCGPIAGIEWTQRTRLTWQSACQSTCEL